MIGHIMRQNTHTHKKIYQKTIQIHEIYKETTATTTTTTTLHTISLLYPRTTEIKTQTQHKRVRFKTNKNKQTNKQTNKSINLQV